MTRALSLLVLLACRDAEGPSLPEPAPSAEPVFVTYTAEAMATRFELILPAGAEGHVEDVLAVFAEVEETANEWRPGTPLALVNAAAGGDPVLVPAETRAIVRRGMELGALTDGAFDVTWAAQWGVWDFRATHPTLPDPAEVARRAALVDYRRVAIDDAAGTVRLPEKGMAIGLGGVAKGWALDRAAALLRERGVTDFSLSAGGQVMAGGHRGDRPWRVGVREPRGAADEWFAVIEASDQSVSTSGDYERYFEIDGVRYHHILDPRTGWPARGVRSATVVSADATTADALSTAIVVSFATRGLGWIEAMEGVEALVVDDAGKVWATDGLKWADVRRP